MVARGYLPVTYVDVWDFKARIMWQVGEEYCDITELIKDGKQLAKGAVYAFGGGINLSGRYPPTREIMEAVVQMLNNKREGQKADTPGGPGKMNGLEERKSVPSR